MAASFYMAKIKYNSQVSWLIFFGSLIVLGIVLGTAFDVGTKGRTLLGLLLVAGWLSVDYYFRRRQRRREESTAIDTQSRGSGKV
ncbi:hypothetical protein ACG98H_05150 [Corynebacterium sp. L4756]|uniref:hypothetical protein n=1 Tax=unclassified Corynebacterium TaxID=2624378 RepID=UPI00374D7537